MTPPCAATVRRPKRRARMGLLLPSAASFVWALPVVGAQMMDPPLAAAPTPSADSILFVPLDDRPTSLHAPVALGAIAGVSVDAPPRAQLGRFTTPADADGVADWLRREAAAQPSNPVVVSIDLLAYGGLVASRRATSATAEAAIARLGALRTVRQAGPRRPVYAFATLMRLAPTADGTDEPYREGIARWAELSADTATAATTELRALVQRIPPDVLARYRAARARNLRVLEATLAMVADGVIDQLVLAQDDARARGVHLGERDTVRAWIAARGLGARVTIQPGADEVGMLLVARAVRDARGHGPAVRVAYAAPMDSARVMPFEDRALDATVRAALATAGARWVPTREATANGTEDVRRDATADLQLVVHTARGRPAVSAAAARLVREATRPVLLADIDPTGAIQGADTLLTDQLIADGTFDRLLGYGAWNTAGNAIGTAVAFGVLRWLATTAATTDPTTAPMAGSTTGSTTGSRPTRVAAARAASPASENAHRAMLLERLLDDDVYHSRLRPALLASLRARGVDPLRLSAEVGRASERDLTAALSARLPWALAGIAPEGRRCRLAQPLRATLPWDRPFEAELDLAVRCE